MLRKVFQFEVFMCSFSLLSRFLATECLFDSKGMYGERFGLFFDVALGIFCCW